MRPREGPSRERAAAPITVFTRRNPADDRGARCAGWSSWRPRPGVEVHVPAEEVEKHGLRAARARCSAPTRRAAPTWRWSWAATARSSPPCAASPGATCRCSPINFGAIGFLATVEREDLDDGLRAGAAGRFEVLGCRAGGRRPPGERSR